VTNLYFCPTTSEKVLLNMARWKHIRATVTYLNNPSGGQQQSYDLLCTCHWITIQIVAKRQWYLQYFGFNIGLINAIIENITGKYTVLYSKLQYSYHRETALTQISCFPQFPREIMTQ
jgi:hypothetical protein